MASTPDPGTWLMGERIPAARFPTPGTTVTGTICEPPRVEQQRDYSTGEPMYWRDGTPRMQLVVTLQTDERDPEYPDDDGRRRLYVRGRMKTAIRQAVKTSGATGLDVGGTLTITYTGDGTPTNPRFQPPKEYNATYRPPASTTAAPPATTPATQTAPGAKPDLNNPEIQALIAQLQQQQR